MAVPFISVVIPIYNEEKYLDNCINSMLLQDYTRDAMEWIFVDGMSTDKTPEILCGYAAQYPQLITVLKNERRTAPCAMNIGIRQAKGRYIIRLDAHAEYAPNYFSKCVQVLDETGADNVGGVMATKAKSPMGALIAKMLSSPFGVGNAQFRINGKDGYVDTVPFGAFRREIFDKVGLYDERLTRNQDSELNYRIIHHGGKIYLSNQIKLSYYCRDTISGIVHMALLNGQWNIVTSKLCPGSMRIRHLIPFLFVLSLICMPILSLFWKPIFFLFLLELICYFLLDILFSIRSAGNLVEAIQLFALFLVFHVSYGCGSLLGIWDVCSGRYRRFT